MSNYNMLKKVCSGAQTGADRAGLDAAIDSGIEVFGYMPKGFLALDGLHPEFAAKYNIIEMSTDKYPPRTKMNVIKSDATLQFATNWGSPGEKLTTRLIKEAGRPSLQIGPSSNIVPESVASWIIRNNVRVLNIAGNSEKTSSGIYKFTYEFLINVFYNLKT